MKISVAMATYNGERYIADQLKSIAEQSLLPTELVVSDDCSTDGTVDAIERFIELAPFEVLLSRNQKTLGYARNFNAALHKTSGDLVFLCDQDDVWYKHKIARMVEAAQQFQDAQVIMCDAALARECLTPVGRTKLHQIKASGLKESEYVMGAATVVRRSFLELVLPIPESFPAHDDWIVRLAEGVGAKLILREVLQLYRRHAGNRSQFLANRLGPVGLRKRLEIKWRNFIGLGTGEYVEKQRRNLHIKDIMLFGAQRATQRCTDKKWRHMWSGFSQRMLTDRDFLWRRMIILALPRRKRIWKLYTLWRRGHYKHCGRFRIMVCDAIARQQSRDGISAIGRS